MDFVGPKPSEAGVLFFDNLNDEVALKAAQEIIALRRWRGQEISPTACVWGCYTLAYDESKKERVNVPVNLGDRFEVIVQIPSRVDKAWFIERFGKNVAVAALSKLDSLSKETRESITPRRLEQALQMWLDKGDMRDVLPMSANVIKLMMMLNDAGR